MSEQSAPVGKGARAEELARSGGRDAWALVLAAGEIADAIRELAEAFRMPPMVIVTPADLDPHQMEQLAAAVRGETPAPSPVPAPPAVAVPSQGKRR